MQWTTEYDGEVYRYVERPSRACIMKGDTALWWGDPSDKIPLSSNVPLVVLLTFSTVRNATS